MSSFRSFLFRLAEPSVYPGKEGFITPDPDQIARDFVSLRALAKQYVWFQMETRIVGPDVAGMQDPNGSSAKIIRRYNRESTIVYWIQLLKFAFQLVSARTYCTYICTLLCLWWLALPKQMNLRWFASKEINLRWYGSYYILYTEPSDYEYEKGLLNLKPEQIGKDFVSFRSLMKQYEWFNHGNRLVGPDASRRQVKEGLDILQRCVF